MRLDLPARPPFSLDQVINAHGWPQLQPFHWNPDHRELRRVERLPSGTVVELLFGTADGGMSVEIVNPPAALADTERQALADAVTWMFGLDQDFSAFYAQARTEPRLAHAEACAKGRMLRSATLWEDCVKTILTTNTTWSGTIRMVEALVTQWGEPLPDDSGRRTFPAPERLARVDADTLCTAGKLGYRAPYVLELAQAIDSGKLNLEALKTSDLPTLELRKRLLAIKGVGGYAAANLLMILGHYDFVPVDSWALKLVANEWHGGRPIGQAEVEAAFKDWGRWKALAYWFWEWTR
jgi:3-methyladenine DNA glycosylase/8-oxoguanine DNA glycosylase